MASGKTMQSTIEISGVLSPSLRAAIDQAVDRLADMSKETLESADAATRLAAEMSEQEDILKTLQKAYAGYAANGEESSEQAQDLAKRIKDVSDELNDNKATLQAAENAAKQLTTVQDNAEDAFRNVGNAAEDAGDDVEDSSDGYTILKDVVADLVTEALDKAAEAFKRMATEGDTALGMLEARTGATASQMEGFEDVMYEVYNANYGDSLEGVGQTLSTVIQMTDDLDNASLAKVTKSAIALEDVFGYDTTESMRAVNSLMDQFGITSDQAFNLIVQGAQNGLDQNGDLLDTINEYAVQFKDAGYSADDMFNMLANGAETGTWSVDKLGDAMKEFNIRMSDGTAADYLDQLGLDAEKTMAQFNKGGPAAQVAIKKVMGAIENCDDATLQYQAGVGLFGTMWEDLGADTVAALMDTQGALSSTNDAMGKMDAAAYDTLANSFSQLGRTVEAEVVQPIAEKLTPVLKNAVDFVTTKVGPAVDWITGHLPEIGIALGTVGALIAAMNWGKIVGQVGKISGAFSKFGGMLKAIPGPALAIIGIVAALAAGFAYLWENNEEFRTNMTAVWEDLQGTFATLGGTIQSMLDQILPLLAEIGTTLLTSFGELAAAIIPVLVQVIGDILPVVIELINQLLPVLTTIVTTVLTVLADLLAQLLPPIIQIIETVLPVLVQLIQTLLPIIMQVVEAVLPIIVDLINQLLPVVTEIITAVLPILVEILNTLTPIFQMIISLLQPILELFMAILQPIIDLIFTAITPLIDIFLMLITTALEPIQPIITALGEIITSVLGAAIQTVAPIVEGLQTVFQGLIDFITGVFSGNWSDAWNGVVTAFGGIWDTVVGLVKAPINGVIGLVNGAIRALNGISVTIPDWVPGIGGDTFGVNLPTIPLLAAGGFTDGVSIAGEEGMEAVISFDKKYRDKNIGIWEQAGRMLGVLNNNEPGAGLTATAGKLLTLDDFSLGSLVDGTSVVIYYDFSNFTWSPQIHGGNGDDEDDLMARLRAHEAEFFDWLEEFIQMREVAQYA